MKSGRIVESGTVDELTRSTGGYNVVVPSADELVQWLQEKDLRFERADGHVRIHVPDRNSANDLIDALRQKNIEIEELAVNRRTIESVFIERVGKRE